MSTVSTVMFRAHQWWNTSYDPYTTITWLPRNFSAQKNTATTMLELSNNSHNNAKQNAPIEQQPKGTENNRNREPSNICSHNWLAPTVAEPPHSLTTCKAQKNSRDQQNALNEQQLTGSESMGKNREPWTTIEYYFFSQPLGAKDRRTTPQSNIM